MTIDNKTSISARFLTIAAARLRFWPLIAIALLTYLATSCVLAHPLFIGSVVAAFYIRGLLRRSLQKRLVAHSPQSEAPPGVSTPQPHRAFPRRRLACAARTPRSLQMEDP